jgi:hypothetical protein
MVVLVVWLMGMVIVPSVGRVLFAVVESSPIVYAPYPQRSMYPAPIISYIAF